MNDLAPVIRVNGLGNEILVADMRGRTDRVTERAALALAQDPATRFDQIMAIHDPRQPGTDFHVEILNTDGSEAQTCGNGMRCVFAALSRETGRRNFRFGTLAVFLEAYNQANVRIS